MCRGGQEARVSNVARSRPWEHACRGTCPLFGRRRWSMLAPAL